MNKSVIIHSGIQTVLQIVKAAQEVNKLEAFYTSFYYKDLYNPILNGLSKTRLNKILAFRRLEGLDDTKIHNIPQYEILEILMKVLIGKNRFTTSNVTHWRDKSFAVNVSNRLKNHKFGSIVSFPNNCLESFQKYHNKLRVIEQPIGHIRSANKILEEEAVLNPDFADSITFFERDERYIERLDKELWLSDKIVTPSSFVRQTLLDNGIDSSKIIVNKYGSFFEPIQSSQIKIHDGELKILFVGQLSQRKGIKYLLDAIKLLKRSRLNIKLTLVGSIFGSGQWLKKYNGIIDEIIFGVPLNKLKEVYLNSDVFVLPSLFEGSALVTYQAVSNGLPLIVTKNTGCDFIAENFNGYMVPIRDSGAIAERISHLYYDRDLLYNLKKNALDISHSLSWDNYHNIYQNEVFNL
jgi:starch synthase